MQLTDPKKRMHTITLGVGKQFHTSKGILEHDELLGRPEGVVVTSTQGVPYLALRPLLQDFVLSMPRGATIVYPKDSALIVGMADLYPGARVLEAGVGSGALTCSLLRAVGDEGYVSSYERREDFAEVARANVATFFGEPHPSWSLTVGDLTPTLRGRIDEGIDTEFDRVVLDMLAPWDCVPVVGDVLSPGGVLVVYVATTTQLSRTVETPRGSCGPTRPHHERAHRLPRVDPSPRGRDRAPGPTHPTGEGCLRRGLRTPHLNVNLFTSAARRSRCGRDARALAFAGARGATRR